MQYLLDFIQEHSFDEQLHLVVRGPQVELGLFWRRAECHGAWQVRPLGCEGPCELVAHSELLQELEARQVDMTAVRRELNALLALQIAVAEMVLRDADQQLGRSVAQRFVRKHSDFLNCLQTAVEQLSARSRPSMAIVEGGGERTSLREGHLSIVAGATRGA